MTDGSPLPVVQALEPCPFCGGEAACLTLGPNDGPGNAGGDMIYCTRCQANSVEFGRKENLVSAWNRRASQAPLLAQLEEMREALKEARGQVVGFMLECGHSPEAAVANVERLDAALAKTGGEAK